ncbi:MAG TPA: mannose-1-phosphate guanylyltransferase/mannose-6-phosphate isomerase [Nitrospiria bacterium]|nr:mannose-1-phosphate guanylyltransferase/mannose-6-phosphate isomerase [Nitrospiria bacterium]
MYAVILAGGSGTRFWPLSREHYPKPLLKIVGEKSLIQGTVTRLAPVIKLDQTMIVTNAQQADQLRFQLGKTVPRFLCEPSGKNTAPAIGLAAMMLVKSDPEAVMAVFPADHLIQKKDVFHGALRTAERAARKDYLVTLGVVPSRPETGYGYIRKGRRLNLKGDGSAFAVARFVEKPKRTVAQRYLRDGGYFWNAGIFVWRAARILEEIERHVPSLHEALVRIGEALGTDREAETLSEVYPSLKPLSIDEGVLERTDRVAVVPCDMGWSDVGSWSALDDVVKRNAEGNLVEGNVINIGSRNSILYGGKRVLAAVGVSDLVVVDTDDATLVCSKGAAQEVKQVVSALKARNGEEHLVHRTVHRPWGSFTVLEKGPGYKIKRIEVNPGAKLSLQMHHKRSEHWVVISGTAKVTCGQSVYTIPSNQSTFVPMGVQHRLENAESVPLVIIEVQSGPYVEEDDIVRFEDQYGRK